MSQIALIILLIPAAAVVGVIWFLIARVAVRRRVARFQRVVPGEFAFTFSSNGWYQEALQNLRDRGVIPVTANDAFGAEAGGVRWASASTTGLSIRRGFGEKPLFYIAWSKVEAISTNVPVSRGRYAQGATGVDVVVSTPNHPAHLVLLSPMAGTGVLDTRNSVRRVADELVRLRGATQPEPG